MGRPTRTRPVCSARIQRSLALMPFLVFAQCHKRLPPFFSSIVEHRGGGSGVKLRFFCLLDADLSLVYFIRCNYDRFCELDLLFASCGFVKISVHSKTPL